VIDKSGRSINGNEGWRLTIVQRRKLSTLSDSKLRGSIDVVLCRSCAVSKAESYIGMSLSTIRFLPIFAKIEPIRLPIQILFVLCSVGKRGFRNPQVHVVSYRSLTEVESNGSRKADLSPNWSEISNVTF
jgi:hypothetical protein